MEKTIKARIKATGETVEVKSKVITSLVTGESLLKYVNQKTGISYFEEELCFPKDLTKDPDYWTRLEHQYAGMAMQGMLSGWWSESIAKIVVSDGAHFDVIVHKANELAHSLVEKMKEGK